MTQTATPVVTRLSFARFASQVRSAAGYLGRTEKQIQKDITDQAPSWVAAHTKDVRNCEVIHLEGTGNHPNWNEDVRRAINKVLPFHKNSAGHSVTLRADGDR